MSEQSARTGRPAAVRMIFEYDGDEIRLISTQPVDVALTGFDLSREVTPAPGHYVQLRSAEGAALAQVPLRNRPSASAEVFPETHGEPIVRTDLERASGAFTVVLPSVAAARQVVVVEVSHRPLTEGLATQEGLAPAPGAGEGATTSVDLASFAFDPAGDGAS